MANDYPKENDELTAAYKNQNTAYSDAYLILSCLSGLERTL